MLPELAKWIPPSFLINGSWEDSYNKTEKELTLSNGSKMDFPTHEMELVKHAGTSRHFVWFDEEPPKAIFNENMARLIDTGGKWWLTETPVEGMTWVYDDIYLASRTNPELFVIEVSSDDNTHLSESQIDMLISFMDDDEKEARRKGKFVQIGGLIYKGFGPHNIIPPVEVGSSQWKQMKEHWTFFEMMDAGFNNPTAWLFGAVNRDGKVLIFHEHYKSGLVVKEHAAIIRKIRSDLEIKSEYAVGDPSIVNTDPISGTSVQIEYALNGLSIVPGNNDVKVGLQVVATAFKERQLFFTQNCEKTIWEHGRYRWATWGNKVSAEKKNVREEPNKKDDHACDAVRYGMCSRPEHVVKVLESLDNLKGLAPSLPSSGERIDYPSRELRGNNQSDSEMGSEF
jgi:PBSX family phage terminase large subunit